MRPLLLLLLLASSLHAAETAAFLDAGPGARALGLGGAFTALADDAHALYWNPAGLARIEKRDFRLSHAELAGGARHEFIAFAHRLGGGALAGGVTYLGHPDFDGRSAAGRETGSIQASDSALALGYGHRTEWLELGAAVKYLRGDIGSAQAHTAAVDLGMRRELERFFVGAALRNLGPGLRYDSERNDLPLRAAFGAGLRFAGGHAAALDVVNGPRGAGTDASLGGEFQALRGVFLRGGYTTRSAVDGGSGFDAARGLTLGVGLELERWTLDYAVLPTGELGRSHRFSIGAKW